MRPGDLVIAADGGAWHCRRLGINPGVVIGDLDSLDQEVVEALVDAGARLIRHPADKDATDLELALRHARDAGVAEALVFGALGARWDQSLANLLLPALEGLESLRVRLVDGPQEARLVRGGETLTLEGRPGDTVSLVPLSGAALGVTTRGLRFPLEDGTLRHGSTRGISNVQTHGQAQISVREGVLVCVQIRGGPEADV
jgi:thiamine pyrophosphokinase